MKKLLVFACSATCALFFTTAVNAQVSETINISATIEEATTPLEILGNDADFGVMRIPTQTGARCIYSPFEGGPHDAFTGNTASPETGCSNGPYRSLPNMGIKNCLSGELQVTISLSNGNSSSGAFLTLLTKNTVPIEFAQTSVETYACDGGEIPLLSQAFPAVVVDYTNSPAPDEVIGQVIIDATF